VQAVSAGEDNLEHRPGPPAPPAPAQTRQPPRGSSAWPPACGTNTKTSRPGCDAVVQNPAWGLPAAPPPRHQAGHLRRRRSRTYRPRSAREHGPVSGEPPCDLCGSPEAGRWPTPTLGPSRARRRQKAIRKTGSGAHVKAPKRPPRGAKRLDVGEHPTRFVVDGGRLHRLRVCSLRDATTGSGVRLDRQLLQALTTTSRSPLMGHQGEVQGGTEDTRRTLRQQWVVRCAPLAQPIYGPAVSARALEYTFLNTRKDAQLVKRRTRGASRRRLRTGHAFSGRQSLG
jgi:hypothetical protein